MRQKEREDTQRCKLIHRQVCGLQEPQGIRVIATIDEILLVEEHNRIGIQRMIT